MFPLLFTKRVPIVVPLLVTALLIAVPALAHLTLVREGRDSAGAAETEDRLGTAVAAGDFNGDGFDDLASGAPQDDHAGAADGQHHGNVIINWGSPFGLTHEGAVAIEFLDDFADNEVRFGDALAAGNFDGDAYSDLVVGVPYRDYVGAQNAGAIYVYMGSASGLTGGYTVYTQVDFGGTREADDLFGFSLAVGDFDGNGTDDIAVGAPGEDNGAGAAFYMYSTPGIGLDALGAGAGFFKQGDLAQTPKTGENFGYALAAGSVFGGFDDLVVGAPYDQPGSELTTPTGRVTLIPSQGGSGLGTLGAIDFNSIELGVPFSHNDSWFGWSLATGRFAHAGGSGVDIAIGEPAHNAGGTFRAGRVVVYQFAAPVYAIDLSSVPGTFVLRGSEDFFGWSVVSGDIDNDGLEELAVGTPNKNALNNTVNWGGMLSVFDWKCNGSVSSMPCSSSVNLDQEWLNDFYREAGMGWSLAFGQFDDTDFGSFAVGAPAADYLVWVDPSDGEYIDDNSLDIVEAGQVHVYAPHRQVSQLRSRSATLHDCDGNLIQSQRMFDPLPMASTTKTMTNFIAAEHITHADTWGIDTMSVYVVPPWIGACMADYGSSANLQKQELVTLSNLMRMSIMVSGNDASMEIGHVLTGEISMFPDTNSCGNKGWRVPAFADSMNARAAELGMNDTHFANAYGSNHPDILNRYARTTALDFYKLGARAMRNDFFRGIVSVEKTTIERTVPGLVFDDDFSNGFLKNLRDQFPSMRNIVQGIKPGSTPGAKQTGLAAARFGDEDDTIAALFGVDTGGWISTKLAQLLALGLNLCDTLTINVVPVPPPPDANASKSGASTNADSSTGLHAELDPVEGSDVLVELYTEALNTTTANAELCVTRSVQYALDPGEAATLEATPFESHEGILLLNESQTVAANLTISHNQPLGTTYSLVLPADEDTTAVPASSFPATSLSLTITNTSSTEKAWLHVKELGYKFDVTLGDGTRAPDRFSTQYTAGGDPYYKSIHALVTGQDATAPPTHRVGAAAAAAGPDNTVHIVIREPGVTTGTGDVGPADGPRGKNVIHAVRNYPNPFNPQTTISFTLVERANVSVDIYDARGRRVRGLVRRRDSLAGEHRITWDGTNESGRSVATGVYFFRVSAGAENVVGKMVLLK